MRTSGNRLRPAVLWLAALGASCSSRSVDEADREFIAASRTLQNDVTSLREKLEALKKNWNTEEQETQAKVHWDRLASALREESIAEQAFRRGELIEAKALDKIREQTRKVLSSDLTVRKILRDVEQLSYFTALVEPRLLKGRKRAARVGALLGSAQNLSAPDRELYQAKYDLANRRLAEMQSLLTEGLKWFLRDATKGAAILSSGLEDLSNLDVTFQDLERALTTPAEPIKETAPDAPKEGEKASGTDKR